MKPRRVLEGVLVPATIVAPYPATVSQRNCLEWFGLTRADYLRLVGRGAFPVKREGKLRIARFVDVEAYLTNGAASHEPPPPKPRDPVANFDVAGALHKAGFRKTTPIR